MHIKVQVITDIEYQLTLGKIELDSEEMATKTSIKFCGRSFRLFFFVMSIFNIVSKSEKPCTTH